MGPPQGGAHARFPFIFSASRTLAEDLCPPGLRGPPTMSLLDVKQEGGARLRNFRVLVWD